MNVFPAIDLRGGRCVRLFQGLADHETVYHEDPAIPAALWKDAGSEWIHVVDLDGAFSGISANHPSLKRILACGLKIQLGGGVRDVSAASSLLDAGVERVVVGTRACREPAFAGELAQRFGPRIAVGIDAKDGLVAVDGWVTVTEVQAIDLAQQVAALGVQTIIYTDVTRDGAMTGPNFEAMEEMLQAASCQVVASGGVSTLDDVRRFAEMGKKYQNLEGIIIGKALYEGVFNVSDALEISFQS
ncbi:MAG: 1-(5-phosphoribosyl)-5-[(5-phosphoribosylamino)methylideneamino]imidazole-4-carboxamide isomerase [Opitutales bacterium]